MQILSSQSNGNGSSISVPRNKSRWDEGLTLYVYGVWDGATAVLQSSPDGGTTWVNIPNASFTADSIVSITGHHTHLRGSVSGGGGSEAINMDLK